MVEGKRTTIRLGHWPRMSLKQAREQAGLHRDRISRTGTAAPPFRETLRSYSERWLDATGRTAETGVGHKWRRNLNNHAGYLLDEPLTSIRVRDIYDILTKLDAETKRMGRTMQRQLSAIFAGAVAEGLLEESPAQWEGRLDKMMVLKKRKATPHASLPPELMPLVYQRLFTAEQTASADLVLAFNFLTATRLSEARFAMWEEIDLDNRVWTIPEISDDDLEAGLARRNKTNTEHIIPLSDEAIRVLKLAKRRFPFGSLVFQSVHSIDGAVARKTMERYFKRRLPEGVSATLHGTSRATFSTWANASGRHRWVAVELALAHRIGNEVSRAYDRGDYLEDKRRLFDDWAAFLVNSDMTDHKVVPYSQA